MDDVFHTNTLTHTQKGNQPEVVKVEGRKSALMSRLKIDFERIS